MKALKNLKPEEKRKFRELLEEETATQEENVADVVDENKSEETENKENLEKEPIDMPDENVIKDDNKVENQPNSSENDENQTQNVVDKENPQENGGEDKEKGVENAPVQDEQPQVLETEPTGNGARVEDLVTKDELMEKLAAFEAKYDALLKENKDLKDKYENKDFGGYQRQGMVPKDKELNQSFEEYSKNFM